MKTAKPIVETNGDDGPDDPSTTMTKYQEASGALVEPTAFDTAFDQTERHNVKVDAPNGPAIYLALCGSMTKILKNEPEREFNIVYFRAHPVEFTDENTGEVKSGIRLAFIDKDRQIYSTTAPGCWRIVAGHWKNQKSKGKFDPPLKVKMVRGGSGTRQFLTFSTELPKDAI